MYNHYYSKDWRLSFWTIFEKSLIEELKIPEFKKLWEAPDDEPIVAYIREVNSTNLNDPFNEEDFIIIRSK